MLERLGTACHRMGEPPSRECEPILKFTHYHPPRVTADTAMRGKLAACGDERQPREREAQVTGARPS